MPNCRNIEFYITNASPSVASQKKEQSVETARRSYLMSRRAHPSCACGYLHTRFVNVGVRVCVFVRAFVWLRVSGFSSPTAWVNRVCFFSLTPDSQPHCDPRLLFDWPETVELEGQEGRWVNNSDQGGLLHYNNQQLIKHTLTSLCTITHGHSLCKVVGIL